MKGQWIGDAKGDNEGQIIINVDDLRTCYEGVAFLLPENKSLPASAGFFRTNNKKNKNKFKAYITAIDPNIGLPTSWDKIKHLYPGITFSKEADVSYHFKKNELHLTAKTDLGSTTKTDIFRKPYTKSSDVPGEIKSWEEYKSFVSSFSGQKKLFRGQRKPWKLKTAFHRNGRYNLFRFLKEDIPLLHRRLTARTSHVFNLEIPNENGAFLNLLQHNGYPTPLLDWTYSPYVAAFFAFRGIEKK